MGRLTGEIRNNKERVGHGKDDRGDKRKPLQIIPVQQVPVWVMREIITKTIGNKENNKEMKSPMTSAWSGVWACG